MYCFSASFCFLCLKHYPKTELLDINKNHIRNTKIVDVLKICDIDSNYCDDSYQVYICEKCVKKLEPFYVFKQKCAKNFTILKGYVNQMKSNANVAFHANLKVLISDPKNGDNNNETTIEYMDMSQFVEAQIQTDEMEKEPEICDATATPTSTMNLMPEGNNLINNEQLYEISKFIYDNHFMNVSSQPDYNDDVIEVASSPDSFNDIPQNSSGSFNESQYTITPSHECKVCSKCFKNLTQLSIHTFLHTLITYPDNEASKSMKYYCTLCTLEFNGLANIKKHLLSHTMDKLYTCDFCKLDFIIYVDYSRHLSLNPAHKSFGCQLCDGRFISERKLKSHVDRKHNICCMFCKSFFETRLRLKEHMMEKHNNTFCYICATSFKSNNILKKHLFDNHFELQTIGLDGKTQYKCTKCDGEFLTKYSLNEHLGGCFTGENTS